MEWRKNWEVGGFDILGFKELIEYTSTRRGATTDIFLLMCQW
jgi:hypothetical protein